jgi:YHS domain-containing protein
LTNEKESSVGDSPLNKVAEVAGDTKDALANAVRDPVCGRLVKPGVNKKQRYVYAGETYYFHASECLDRFAEQPEVFLSQLGEGGKNAPFDRASRPEDFQHRGELRPGTPATLEQARVESGSG